MNRDSVDMSELVIYYGKTNVDVKGCFPFFVLRFDLAFALDLDLDTRELGCELTFDALLFTFERFCSLYLLIASSRESNNFWGNFRGR